jgi:hypothetical protein
MTSIAKPAPKFSLSLFQNSCSLTLSRLVSKGRFAIVTRREAGMRWPRGFRSMSFNGVRTNEALADVKLRGPGAPMLAPSPVVMMIAPGDGG